MGLSSVVVGSTMDNAHADAVARAKAIGKLFTLFDLSGMSSSFFSVCLGVEISIGKDY